MHPRSWLLPLAFGLVAWLAQTQVGAQSPATSAAPTPSSQPAPQSAKSPAHRAESKPPGIKAKTRKSQASAAPVGGSASAGSPAPASARPAPAAHPAPTGRARPARFGFADVQRLARQRAAAPYVNRSPRLPDSLATLSYNQYRYIRFRADHALWRGQGLFEVQFFHRGFAYRRRVNITDIALDGTLHPLSYSAADFDYSGSGLQPQGLPANLGFAGFRVRYPLQQPDRKDELIVFLGASDFRVLGRNQDFGAWARGLAIDVASADGEEYPYFTDFWLVQPQPQQRTLEIYALLDSPSLTGAYRFEIRPSGATDVEVTATLYPRHSVTKLGIAPLNSMYFYGENSPRAVDDYRPEVHDSDGLEEQAGDGEWLWRPLSNPKTLTVSSFQDDNPRGFGLVQRDRDFDHYQDEAAQYQRRPSYWVAPLGNWGQGRVELVEIPSSEEIHDNIIAYWVPATPLTPGQPFNFSYLLTAYLTSPLWPPGGRAIATRTARVDGHPGD
ncbi:MAG: glucan biosynthesis protein, partial [Acetobacteraceae bacterium]